jgi:integrase
MRKKLREKCYRIDFRDKTGRRYRLNYPTRKEADDKLTELKGRIRKNEFVAPQSIPKFAEVAEQWLALKSDRRPGTVNNWRAQVNGYLTPKLGTLRLDLIDTEVVEQLQVNLTNKLSPRTINAIRTTLAAILNLAIRRGYIAGKNPVADAVKPFSADQEIMINEHGEEVRDRKAQAEAVRPEEVLGPDEIRRLVDAATPGLYRTLFATAALTGLRSGELFGLRWSDIEIERENADPKIFVRRSLTWARGAGEEGTVVYKFYSPKTKAGRRDVSVPPELAAVLRAWKLRCPVSGTLDLVFCTVEGKPVRRSNALRYGLWPALSRAGLRRVNMHSLRHSFASMLIALNTPITEVAKRLGHSTPAVTLDVYAHFMKATESNSVNRLAESILPRTTQTTSRQLGHYLGTPESSPTAEAV